MRWEAILALFLVAIGGGTKVVLSQTTSAQREEEIERQNALEVQRRIDLDLQQRMRDFRTLEDRMRNLPRFHTNPEMIPELTSEQKARVRMLRRVDPRILDAYKQLLAQKGTGAFNIFPDMGCMTKDVVNVNDACQQQVQLSNAFSFRRGEYGDPLYHDLWFDHDRFVSDAFFTQGILTSLGERPLADMTLRNARVAALMSFPADSDPASAAEHAKDLTSGVTRNGSAYSNSIRPEIGKTYLLRVIAYKLANNLKPINDESDRSALLFHSLEADKRADIVVAFTVAAATQAGGYTIVWKELLRKDAPKIRFEKGKRLADFKVRRSPELQQVLIPNNSH